MENKDKDVGGCDGLLIDTQSRGNIEINGIYTLNVGWMKNRLLNIQVQGILPNDYVLCQCMDREDVIMEIPFHIFEMNGFVISKSL